MSARKKLKAAQPWRWVDKPPTLPTETDDPFDPPVEDTTEIFEEPVQEEPQQNGESSEQPLRWYKKTRAPNATRFDGIPYELKAISFDHKHPMSRGMCAQFFPFTGPRRKIGEADFSDWENCCATVAGATLLVARCTDDNPWDVLWDMTVAGEELYHVAWTYHPYTLHPLIAFAGRVGLIYIVDAVNRSCFKILRGHGDDIMHLTFHEQHVHILASASSDKTTRIWNILGAESELPDPRTGDKVDENYPMGMADEGSVIVAVLAGEGSGGHRDQVVGAAFHPRYRAIATCGCDHIVKIWSLPPFPEAKPNEMPTPIGYRPVIVYFPLFSTNRLHEHVVDTIEWLSDDVLISHAAELIITWRWLGFRRFFRKDQFEAVNSNPQRTDFHSSHSFTIIARHQIIHHFWYKRFGLHRAFWPTSEEREAFDEDTNLVQDYLLAMSPFAGPPGIHVWNPLLAQADDPPDPIEDLRPDTDVESDSPSGNEDGDDVGDADDREDEDMDEVDGQAMVGHPGTVTDGRSSADMATPPGADADSAPTPQTDVHSMVDIISNRGKDTPDSRSRSTPAATVAPASKAAFQSIMREAAGDEAEASSLVPRRPAKETDPPIKVKRKHGNLSLAPRVLKVKEWNQLVKSQKKQGTGSNFDDGRDIITNVAFSPRGARWIVAVGAGDSVFVWKLKKGERQDLA